MVKKIAIFGATGGVGLHVTEIALKKDFQLKVLVRDPSRLREDLRSKVEVIQGDVTNASDMFRTVEGQDAVVVVLGTRDSLMVIHPDYRGKGLGKFIMACTEDYVRRGSSPFMIQQHY
ncbi:flavin reductase (NADPH)-like isoform X2 [Periplaneta americana]|uniref:flavin reductase (NADPH)-like isoform X2 n=1 Tax=Periplaneta americana TaxID=6978 RepID=UPI0037E97A4B